MLFETAETIAHRLQRAASRGVSFSRRRLFGQRPFTGSTRQRLLLLSLPERIPQSQIEPFHYYARDIRSRFDVQIREADARRYLADAAYGPDDASIVCFQSDFLVTADDLRRTAEQIRSRNPRAKLVYLDWFAPTDLRFAAPLDPLISVYVKKHVLRDEKLYGRPTLGDTNLTDHFAKRFGLDLPTTVFPVPEKFREKLLVGPTFLTADFLLDAFRRPRARGARDRAIDVHARLATEGDDWYRLMRQESARAVADLEGWSAVMGTGVGHQRYMAELRRSKICFSPFGYGEVCWRDYESIASGAVLLKPDMSHIRTDPDIFVAGETYVPVRWDLEDFSEKVEMVLKRPDLRQHLAENAFRKLHAYVAEGRFADQLAPIFV